MWGRMYTSFMCIETRAQHDVFPSYGYCPSSFGTRSITGQELPDLVRLGQLALGALLFSTHLVLGSQTPEITQHFLMWILRIKLRFSHLPGKHFTDVATSAAQNCCFKVINECVCN